MAVTALEIHRREPYEDGTPFGDAGPYERIDGVVRFAVDPAHPANALIVDLERAARGADGRVHFPADFTVLQPADPARAARCLLYNVANRGRRVIPGSRAPVSPEPTARIHPGDGFLLRRGWTIAWCGWQWDVVRGPALIGLEAPQALDDAGRPIQGQVTVQFQPNDLIRDHLLADRAHTPYPAADVDDPDAVLTVRDWLDGERTVIPRGRWRFARDVDGRPRPDDTHVWLEGGFAPGKVYEVVYRTRICPVVGTGLLATRDFVSFLRYAGTDAGNPCAGALAHMLAQGASQSGRFLRHFLYLGLNVDEAGRQVFDGMLPHVAGAHRGEFNHRFAQPSVQATRGFGQLPPFADEPQTGPDGERHEGLLARPRAVGGVPRIFYTNTAAEYWPGDCSRGDASLLHTDLAGTRDVEPPPEVRVYYFAGTQHGPGQLPPPERTPDGTRGVHLFNVVDFSTLLRAAIVNLERWVTAGEEPPPSAFPRLADGTAVPIRRVLEAFRAFPSVTLPDPDLLPASRRLDLGPEAERGVGRYPPVLGAPYPSFVAAVDADGNEVAGIRLPDVAVPVATVTGWNPRHPDIGGAGQIVWMQGSTLPFPATRAERERTGDPRPAIAERYADEADYLARARAVAEELARRRYLLPEDVELAAQLALQRYRAFAAAPQPVT
jgi:hypothetical protein